MTHTSGFIYRTTRRWVTGSAQAAVTIVLAIGNVEEPSREPLMLSRLGHLTPRHAIGGNRLVFAVDGDGVVRPRRSERVPPVVIEVVGERARIDQKGIPRGVQVDAEGIGMSVSCETVSDGAAIENEDRIGWLPPSRITKYPPST